MTDKPGTVSVELLNNERRVSDMVRAENDKLRTDNERLRALVSEMDEALNQMITWCPSGFAPQSQGIAYRLAGEARAKARAALEPMP